MTENPKWFPEPTRFGFFQAVRLLVSAFSKQGGAEPERRIRFVANPSFAFPASEIQAAFERDDGGVTVMINFLGLTGPLGVLPSIYTEHLIRLDKNGDRSALDFFDLFNNRLAWQFYRAWEKHHVQPSYEQEWVNAAGASRFTGYLLSLIGLGTPGLVDAPHWAQSGKSGGDAETLREGLLFYAGILSQHPRNASNLRGLLSDRFQVETEIVQCLGEWVDLPRESLSWLEGSGAYNQLGCGAVAGDRVWNPQAGFLVRMGPLSYKRYSDLLPPKSEFQQVSELTSFFTDWGASVHLQLVLRADQVPRCSLREDIQLGLDSWLERGGQEAAGDFVCRLF